MSYFTVNTQSVTPRDDGPLGVGTDAKLRDSSNRVRIRARAKGLDAIFEYEIFELGQMAQEAINKQSHSLARDVLRYERELLRRISDMPGKRGPIR